MFQNITDNSEINYTGASYGVAWGDYNQDGFIDLWVGNHGVSATLYQNEGDGTFTNVTASVFDNQPRGDFHGAAWADFDRDGDLDLIQLEIDLEGVFSNRDGIGAKVYVTAGGVTQLRQQTGGMHDQVQNDSRLHFGLADNTMIEEIKIEWSSGTIQSIDNINADQILNIVESDI